MAISIISPSRRFQLTRVTVRPILAREESEWDGLLERHHDLGPAPFPGHRIKYVAEHEGAAVALLSFSACAYHLADRDRWLGWSAEQALQRRQFVVQNSRLAIVSDKGRRQNLASRVLALSTRRLATDWQERFGYAPLMVETFVDAARHRGTCYQAAGWVQVGNTCGFRRDGREFYKAGSSPKQVWMKALRPDARELLRGQVLPGALRAYEKPLPAKQVAKRLGVEGLRSLFMVLQQMHDPRSYRGQQYPLGCCLSILVCAVLAGCRGVRECAEFADSLSVTHRRALRGWRNPRTGQYEMPKHVTLWRMLRDIDAAELERTVNQWFREEKRLPEVVAIDGKALRATLNNEEGPSCAVSVASHPGTPLFSLRLSPPRKARRSTPLKG